MNLSTFLIIFASLLSQYVSSLSFNRRNPHNERQSSFTIERVTLSRNHNSTQMEMSQRKRRESPSKYAAFLNVSQYLDQILEDYDKTLRPNFNRESATDVYVDIFVRTMGLISEKTDSYSFDCYFRQTWTDDRLKFSQGTSQKVLSLSMAMLDKIWKPDIYFWNGAGSYVHTLTVPNRLVRLSSDGTVLFSMRLTVKAKCRMDLHRYPLDKQACRLVLASFAYPVEEMKLHWKVDKSNEGVQMDYAAVTDLPQFTVTGFQVLNGTFIERDKNYSALEVRFFFDRHFGYFLMNFYVPCSLIVLLCWVAFWINREATQERIGLVITNVLTMMFISLDSKTDAPRTEFPTALDVYIWICLSFLFISMVEFTLVHYFTKYNTGDPELLELEREKIRQIIRSIPRRAVLSSRHYNRPHTTESTRRRKFGLNGTIGRGDGGRFSMYSHKGRPRKKTSHQPLSITHSDGGVDNLQYFHRDAIGWRLYYFMLDQQSMYDPFFLEGNSISSIDKGCRVGMPLLFLIVVLFYYQFYVKTPFEFEFESTQGPSLLP